MEPLSARPLRIGLTGGIGSGKSTAAAAFVAHGDTLIDTDAIARALTEPDGAAMPAIRAAFGAGLIAPDGALDRAAMRTLAFRDPSVRRRLEAVLHPLIGEQAALAAARATSDVIVFDVPLLAESPHWRRRVHRVLVIDCDANTQIDRIVQRPGWTREAAEGVIAAQASRSTRRALADAVIHNGAALGIAELGQAVRRLRHLWLQSVADAVEQ